MLAFLQFILIALLVVIFIVGIFIWRVFFQVKNAAKNMKQQMGDAAKQRNKKQTVEDRRDPDHANRKIIPKDEGEYVDYKEC